MLFFTDNVVFTKKGVELERVRDHVGSSSL